MAVIRRSQRSIWGDIVIVMLVIGGAMVLAGMFLVIGILLPLFGAGFMAGQSMATTVIP